MHTLIGVSLVSVLLSAGPGVPPTGPITPDETDQVHEWPAVKQGVWSIEGMLKPKKGKPKKWKATAKRCDDAAQLFQGYWGRGKAILADRSFWRQHGFVVARTFPGWPLAVAAVSLVGSGVYFVFLPIYYRWVDFHIDSFDVDTIRELGDGETTVHHLLHSTDAAVDEPASGVESGR